MKFTNQAVSRFKSSWSTFGLIQWFLCWV